MEKIVPLSRLESEFSAAPPGVYVLRDEHGNPLYVTGAQDLEHALPRIGLALIRHAALLGDGAPSPCVDFWPCADYAAEARAYIRQQHPPLNRRLLTERERAERNRQRVARWRG